MNVLIVEDDPHKLSQLKREVVEIDKSALIEIAMSLQEATTILSGSKFDVVLLDMAIPSHGGDAAATDVYSQPVGGLDVLLYLATSARSERVIVLTQYPTVEYNQRHVPLRKVRDVLHGDDVTNLESVVFFSEDGAWKGRLRTFLKGVE